jgi:hypothetical protein
MNDLVEDSGNLLNQKSIGIVVAGYGQATDGNWLKHCIPGSANHFSCLKESPSILYKY